MMVYEVKLKLNERPTALSATYFFDELDEESKGACFGWTPSGASLIFFFDENANLDNLIRKITSFPFVEQYEIKKANRSDAKLDIISKTSKAAREIMYNIYALSDLCENRINYINTIFAESNCDVKDINTLERLRRILASNSILYDEMLKQELVKRTLAMM